MTKIYADFQIEVWGNTLFVTAIGPTGEAELKWLREEITNKYLSFLSPGWAILGDARKWELHTEEAKKMTDDFFIWATSQGLRLNLVLVPENSIKLAAAQEVNSKGTLEHQYAFSMEEAIEWLSSKKVWGQRKI